MEYIREVKIKIEVDTNKSTYSEEFTDIDDATKYLNNLLERIRG